MNESEWLQDYIKTTDSEQRKRYLISLWTWWAGESGGTTCGAEHRLEGRYGSAARSKCSSAFDGVRIVCR
jgi:hypothetical protein